MLKLSIDNINFGVYQCGPEWIVNEKGSVFHRLYYVYEGTAVYRDSSRQFVLEKDHIYLFPVNRPYSITQDIHQPFKCLFFHITTYPLILNQTIDTDARQTPEIYHLIKVLEYTAENRSKYEASFINRLVEDLLFLIGKKTEFYLLSDERLQKVIDYIHNRYHLKITNTELSALAGYDRSYFIRLFRKTLGDTPQSYILKYRLIKAVNFLSEDLSVKEVSIKVGFEDMKSFSRAFKKHKGCSPGEYKKSHFLQP